MAALLVSSWGLVEQRAINADQKSINEDQRRVIEDTIRANNETRAEKKMEYASGVTWWLDGNDWLSVYIQNRSGVPISDVRLRYRAIKSDQDFDRRDDLPAYDGSPVVQIDVIPPCRLMTVHEPDVQYELFGEPWERPNESGILDIEWVSIEFTDAHGRWSVTSGGVPEAVDGDYPAFSAESDLQLIPYIRFMDEQQIDGCGG